MSSTFGSDHAWGAPKVGLRAGLRLAGSPQDLAGEQLFGAIRNIGSEQARAPAICELHVRTPDGEATLAEGPRATSGQVLEPGETLEAFGWRITADVCRPHRRCSVRMWCLLAPAVWLLSGEVEVDFGA